MYSRTRIAATSWSRSMRMAISAPFYAVRRYLRSTGEESFAAYQQRVAADLFTLAAQFKEQGIPVYSIAVPYGDYGQQDVGNDPRIVPFLLPLMRSQFGTVFVQADRNDPPYTTPTDGGPQKRWEARSRSTAEQLYGWLSANDPSRAPSPPAAPGRDTKQHQPELGVRPCAASPATWDEAPRKNCCSRGSSSSSTAATTRRASPCLTPPARLILSARSGT